MSLRLRLHLLITTLSLAFLLAAGWVIVDDTRVSIRERVEAATRVTVQLLDTVIVSSYQNPEWGYTHEVLHSFLQSLGYVRSNQITLRDGHGALLYQSPPSTFRSNVVPPQWFITLVEPKQEVVKRRIRFGTLEVASSSIGSIREAWSGVRQLMGIGLGFFLLLNGMVFCLKVAFTVSENSCSPMHFLQVIPLLLLLLLAPFTSLLPKANVTCCYGSLSLHHWLGFRVLQLERTGSPMFWRGLALASGVGCWVQSFLNSFRMIDYSQIQFGPELLPLVEL